MEMQLEVDEEYKRFLKDIKDRRFIFDCYMDETWYEDNHSHNSIWNAMEILKGKSGNIYIKIDQMNLLYILIGAYTL